MYGDLLEAFETEFSWTNVDNLSSLKQWYTSYKVNDSVSLPGESTGTTLICYEMVMYLAAKCGALSKSELAGLYDQHYVSGKGWKTILASSEQVYSTSTHSPRPERGDVVFFNNLGHVAMATGATSGDESGCLSFWGYVPIPTADGRMSVTAKIEETTLEALSRYMVSHGPAFVSGAAYTVEVRFGKPPW